MAQLLNHSPEGRKSTFVPTRKIARKVAKNRMTIHAKNPIQHVCRHELTRRANLLGKGYSETYVQSYFATHWREAVPEYQPHTV